MLWVPIRSALALLMSTHNTCFQAEIRKIYTLQLEKELLYLELCFRKSVNTYKFSSEQKQTDNVSFSQIKLKKKKNNKKKKKKKNEIIDKNKSFCFRYP